MRRPRLVVPVLLIAYPVAVFLTLYLVGRGNDRLHRYAPIFSSLITAAFTLFGVAFSIFTIVYMPAEIKRIESKLAYVEEQLRTLYGPLLAECLQADSTFRRVELSIARLTTTPEENEHRHYDYRQISVADFTEQIDPSASTVKSRRQLFAKMLRDVYVLNNKKRLNILKHSLHLLGPNPPLSLALFLAHSTQLESLVRVKQVVDLRITDQELGRYEDPYVLAPFPANMTGEVFAKVAWLKALQREYRYRLARSTSPLNFLSRKQVYIRDHYFIMLNENLREELNKETACDKERKEHQQAFHPHTFPLVWGPYVAVELFELRCWLITREVALRCLTGLVSERKFLVALLQGPVIKYDKGGGLKLKVHHRVAQSFDELDKPGSKMNFAWDCDFTWEKLKADQISCLETFSYAGFSLQNIRKAPEIAYHSKAYEEMLDMYSGRQD